MVGDWWLGLENCRDNVIERCSGELKHARRIAARYKKTSANFLAALKLSHGFKAQLRGTT